MCGEYCAIAADIDANLNTFYFLKVGTTRGEQEDRCDAQRLKLVWSLCAWAYPNNHEKAGKAYISYEKPLIAAADSLFGRAKIDYRAAGHTESFGHFSSAQEANNAAQLLLRTFKARTKFTGVEGPVEFKLHREALPVKAPKGLLNKVRFYCNPI